MIRTVSEHAYFLLCLGLGRVLRSGRYSKVQIFESGGVAEVRKRRLFYAPLLVWAGGPLVSILDTGVRVLAQRDWEAQEDRMYKTLYGSSIRKRSDGTLVLPHLPGQTLATLLDDPKLDEAIRGHAIALAVTTLAEFHAAGFTHGDAMAENVMIDIDAGTARQVISSTTPVCLKAPTVITSPT